MDKTKSKILRTELSVLRKEYITPNYLRVFLTSEDVSLLGNATPGANIKIVLPPQGNQTSQSTELNKEGIEPTGLSEEKRPIVRTYTLRGIDLGRNEIWIDFVVEEGMGPATEWALNAKQGDAISVLVRDVNPTQYMPSDYYLLAGDGAAIPVLATILENLPSTAKGVCLIEVVGQEDEQPLFTKADIRFTWLHKSLSGTGSGLAQIVRQQKLPSESKFGYIAAELSSVKEIRTYLRKERNWKREELNAFSFWKLGVPEDSFAAERQQDAAS